MPAPFSLSFYFCTDAFPTTADRLTKKGFIASRFCCVERLACAAQSRQPLTGSFRWGHRSHRPVRQVWRFATGRL